MIGSENFLPAFEKVLGDPAACSGAAGGVEVGNHGEHLPGSPARRPGPAARSGGYGSGAGSRVPAARSVPDTRRPGRRPTGDHQARQPVLPPPPLTSPGRRHGAGQQRPGGPARRPGPVRRARPTRWPVTSPAHAVESISVRRRAPSAPPVALHISDIPAPHAVEYLQPDGRDPPSPRASRPARPHADHSLGHGSVRRPDKPGDTARVGGQKGSASAARYASVVISALVDGLRPGRGALSRTP